MRIQRRDVRRVAGGVRKLGEIAGQLNNSKLGAIAGSVHPLGALAMNVSHKVARYAPQVADTIEQADNLASEFQNLRVKGKAVLGRGRQIYNDLKQANYSAEPMSEDISADY